MKRALSMVHVLNNLYNSGLGNVRPAGHMQPAERLNVAREHFFLNW